MKTKAIIFFCLIFIKCFSQSIDSLEVVIANLKHDSIKINVLYREGFANRSKNPQYSFDCAITALKLNKAKDDLLSAQAYNLLGILYYKKGDYTTAINYHQQALKIREQFLDTIGIAFSKLNLGNVLSEIQNFKKAELYYLDALAVFNAKQNHKQTIKSLINLGVLNYNLNDFNAARRYFNMVVMQARQNNDYESEAMGYNNLAAVNIKDKKTEDAKANLFNSLKVKEMMGNEVEKTDSYISLAQCFALENDLRSAAHYLNLSDSMIKKFDYQEAKTEWNDAAIVLAEKQNDFKQAFLLLKQNNIIKDSLLKLNELAQNQKQFIDEHVAKNTPVYTSNATLAYIPFIVLFLLALFAAFITFYFKR
ncbi:MAG: tetratricopeptide repeat protein [Bacteroidetes bacterium]|nr:tetratricopeptide repeat protein [Bacteroidota bacterium]